LFSSTTASDNEILSRPPIKNSIGMELKLLPAGTFMIGSNFGAAKEQPVHKVTLSQNFYIGVHEVTQEQYEKVTGVNPSRFKGASNPVEQVSWADAIEFCRKLSELSTEKAAGRVYRLPTGAEWEFACRAGTTTKYSFGDDQSKGGDYAWFMGNSGKMTHPVGGKQSNAWGLYDMYGNVWEWCQDWYHGLPRLSVTDPVGPSRGSTRVRCGGCWKDAAVWASPARIGSGPARRDNYGGFRVVFTATATSAFAFA
jgi:formylglycine-generating enzyme required for sulfatase activity